jgi:hypothetical protein
MQTLQIRQILVELELLQKVNIQQGNKWELDAFVRMRGPVRLFSLAFSQGRSAV